MDKNLKDVPTEFRLLRLPQVLEIIRLLDELSGWVRCFWVVGLLLNPVGRAFPVDVTGGGQGRAL